MQAIRNIAHTTAHTTAHNIAPTLRATPARRFAVPAALALGASSGAQAQSNVTLYGLIDLSVGSFQPPGDVAKKGVTVADTTTWQLAGSYDFKGVKLYAQYGEVANDSSLNSCAISGIGGELNIGAGKLMAQYSQVSPDLGGNRKPASLGYDHFLSKRTDLYTVYMQDRLGGLANGNSDAAGVRHRF